MSKRFHSLFIPLAAGMLILLPPALRAAPLPQSELLTYKVTWKGIPAGTITQDLQKTGNATYRLTVTAESNGFVNMFYRLDSFQQSVFEVSGDRLRELNYEHINKGKEPFPRHVVFDWRQDVAHLKNEDGRRDVPLTPYTFDPNTLTQQLRFFPDSVAQPYISLDGKNTKNLNIQKLGTRRINTPAGTFEAQCLRQADKNPANKRSVSVCFSNDARRLPVEIRFESPYGDFVAHLTSVKEP